MWKRSGKALVEKKGERSPKLSRRAGLVPIRDQRGGEEVIVETLNGSLVEGLQQLLRIGG